MRQSFLLQHALDKGKVERRPHTASHFPPPPLTSLHPTSALHYTHRPCFVRAAVEWAVAVDAH